MTGDDLRALPIATDPAGVEVGWVPVPVAMRDALADLIGAARGLNQYGHRRFSQAPGEPGPLCAKCANPWPCPATRIADALAALDAAGA